jgi:hypothetical protein
MNKFFLNVIAIFLLSLFLIGCAMKTTIKTTNTDIKEMADSLTLQQIEQSIYKAATELGWRLYAVESGHVMGDYTTAKYLTSVDIRFTKDGYTISYNNSKNLKYDGEKILSFYNTQIEELDKKIQEVIGRSNTK